MEMRDIEEIDTCINNLHFTCGVKEKKLKILNLVSGFKSLACIFCICKTIKMGRCRMKLV